jgi:hypothetical protein
MNEMIYTESTSCNSNMTSAAKDFDNDKNTARVLRIIVIPSEKMSWTLIFNRV